MTSRTGSVRRILGIWRKLVELRLDTGREGLTFACSRRPWEGVVRDGGGRWKSQNRKIVPLSPYVEKFLKVIKGFVPELRSRKCFSCLEKQRWTHKRCTLMDPHTWPRKSRTTSSNVHSAAMWGYRLLSWRPT